MGARAIRRFSCDVAGERLWVVDTETPSDGEARLPLLVLNGIGASTTLLEPLLGRLARHRVIAFDPPGIGSSPAPRKLRRMPGYAALARDLLDALGLERVNVLGVSWGGGLAQQFARHYPERCGRLVLAATAAGLAMVPPSPRVLLRMATPLRYASAAYFKRVAGSIYGGDLRHDRRALEWLVRRMAPPSWSGYASQVYALAGWTSLPWLHRLRLPTLVMAGADDPIVRLVNARLLAARIPGAELEVYDCGHLFLLTRLERVVERLDDFLG